MKGRKIIFQQTFPTGQFQNQKLGIEIDLDGEEEVDEVFAMAKKVVNDAFVALNPQIQWEQPSTLQASFSNEPTNTSMDFWKSVSPINKEPEPRTTEDKIIEDINSCKDFKTLETYKFIQKQSPALTEAYNNKLKSFQ